MADVAGLTVLEAFGAITQGGVALIASAGRSIDSIVPNVVMEETSTDTLTTTDHPVETGVAVSDHSFRNPAELEMRVLWSDSSAQSVGYSIAVYNELQALQATRQPFPVQTGKRTYGNMLFRALVQRTDPTSEYALTVVATFKELITVQSATAGSSNDPTTPTTSSDPASQANPQSTAAATDAGTGTGYGTIGTNSSDLFGQMGASGGGNVVSLSGVSGAPLNGTLGSSSQTYSEGGNSVSFAP